jgi:uncharacterized protein YjiS (DUF1127 family)
MNAKSRSREADTQATQHLATLKNAALDRLGGEAIEDSGLSRADLKEEYEPD